MKTYLNFVLSAHLPYIRDPGITGFVEGDWLFENLCESYIPLLEMFSKLESEGVKYKLNLSISPTLIEMFRDSVLREQFSVYLDKHISLCEKEVVRTKALSDPLYHVNAENYLDRYKRVKALLEVWSSQRTLSFLKTMIKRGRLDVMATAATNPYFPLFQDFPEATGAQIDVGCLTYMDLFGAKPNQFHLPLCGYYSGLDKIIHYHCLGAKTFNVSPFAFAWCEQKVNKGVYAPVKTPSGMFAFAREFAIENLVVSPFSGYPGASEYREFYRDIGFDLPFDHVKECLHPGEKQGFTGIKYHKVSRKDSPDKAVYDPSEAMATAIKHAHDFVDQLKEKASEARRCIGDDPVITISFDAELFGHFWAEGVVWLKEVLSILSSDKEIEMIFPHEYASKHAEGCQVVEPALSSATTDGNSDVFLCGRAETLYHSIFHTLTLMSEIAKLTDEDNMLLSKMFSQAARESLLIMSSDWSYMVATHSSSLYAESRIVEHADMVQKIYDSVARGLPSPHAVIAKNRKYPLFDSIDYHVFAQNKGSEA